MDNSLQGILVPIGNKVVCWWSHGHSHENLNYLRSIHSDYFSSVAAVLMQHDLKANPSLAIHLRTLRDTAAEMLFALLASYVQQPFATCAWMSLYKTADLDGFLDHVFCVEEALTYRGMKEVRWSAILNDLISNMIHHDIEHKTEIVGRFASFVEKLHCEYVDPVNRNEHNCIKHGVRAKAHGGMKVSFGKSTDEQSGSNEIRSAGYGTSTYRFNLAWGKRGNYTITNSHNTWCALAIYDQICIINSLVIGLLMVLRDINGESIDEVWLLPSDMTIFDRCWSQTGSLFSIENGIKLDDIPSLGLTAEQMREKLLASDSKVLG